MSGDCPECDDPMLWAGMSWEPHTQARHDGARRRLYGAIARLLDQEVRNRFLVAQAASQGLVGIRMNSGVYRGLVMWHTISGEFWDELGRAEGMGMGADRAWFLRHLRGLSTDGARWKYGVDVNPATWSHKIYDDR